MRFIGKKFKKNEKFNREDCLSRHLNSERAFGYTYPLVIIELALCLVTKANLSYRSIPKVFKALNRSLNLGLKEPSHTTVLIWMKKQGIANFKDKSFFEGKKWFLIIDESIQFGNKKLMVVMAVLSSAVRTKALTYLDLIPLVLKSSTSWKAEQIKQEIINSIDVKDVEYVVSDNGNNLKSACNILDLIHIEDINHKISGFIKSVYEKDAVFESYTKHLSGLRGKLSLSKVAHLIPPNQRIISRFMNLTPLFVWGEKTLKLIENQKLNIQELEKVAFLPSYKAFVIDTLSILNTLNLIQKNLKTNHFDQVQIDKCLLELDKFKSQKGLMIAEKMRSYFEATKLKLAGNCQVVCSSDIIESCFGKYKEVVKLNKTIGISDICLSISCLTNKDDIKGLKNALENTKIEDIKKWNEENIGESLFKKRNILYKEKRGNKNIKKVA